MQGLGFLVQAQYTALDQPLDGLKGGPIQHLQRLPRQVVGDTLLQNVAERFVKVIDHGKHRLLGTLLMHL